MKIITRNNLFVGNILCEAGKHVDVPELAAKQLIAAGQAVRAKQNPAIPATPVEETASAAPDMETAESTSQRKRSR